MGKHSNDNDVRTDHARRLKAKKVHTETIPFGTAINSIIRSVKNVIDDHLDHVYETPDPADPLQEISVKIDLAIRTAIERALFKENSTAIGKTGAMGSLFEMEFPDNIVAFKDNLEIQKGNWLDDEVKSIILSRHGKEETEIPHEELEMAERLRLMARKKYEGLSGLVVKAAEAALEKSINASYSKN